MFPVLCNALLMLFLAKGSGRPSPSTDTIKMRLSRARFLSCSDAIGPLFNGLGSSG